MKQYKIIDSRPNRQTTEDMLNTLAHEGWIVSGFTQYQILLEREANENKDEKVLLRD